MKNILNKKLNLIMTISISLLVLFGFYKNGILLYQKGYIPFIEMFRPLLIVFMCVSGAVVGSFIRERKKDKKIKLDYLDKLKAEIIESAILACVLPISSSPLLLFIPVMLVYLFIDNSKVNRIALLFLIISGLNIALQINTFENAYELSTELHYGSLDLFFGMGVGGIAATCIFLIGVSLFILSFNKIYKRDITISSIIAFILLTFIIAITTNNYSAIFKTLFSHNILFALVFAAPITYCSSYTTKGQVLSGILISIITVVLSYFIPYEAVFISILLVSLIKNIIDRIFVVL